MRINPRAAIFLVLIFVCFQAFPQKYRIEKVNYSLEKTRELDLKRVVPVNTDKIFESKEELDSYLLDLKQRLMNTRAFDNVEVRSEEPGVPVGDDSGTVFDETRASEPKKPFSQVLPATPSLPIILVWNKCDLAEKSDSMFDVPQVRISAKKGIGLGELSEAVRSALSVAGSSERNSTGLGSERQKISVEKALESVRHALALSEDYALDAVVQDLEDSLDALGEVTGDVTPDDVLGSIFSHFCVGK